MQSSRCRTTAMAHGSPHAPALEPRDPAAHPNRDIFEEFQFRQAYLASSTFGYVDERSARREACIASASAREPGRRPALRMISSPCLVYVPRLAPWTGCS